MKTKFNLVYLATLLVSTLGVAFARAAVVNWTNTSGGLWSAVTNWSTGAAPVESDDVFMTVAGSYTVTQDVHVTITSLTLGGASGTQTLTNAGANLTLNGAGTVNAHGVLGIGGGTLAGPGTWTVGGEVVWSGGAIEGAILIAANGTLAIGGSGTKFLRGGGIIVNQGVITWSGTNDIETGNSARLINQPGALFDIQNNQSLAIANGGAITNFGVIRKTAGGGGTLITVPLYNAGTLDVQSGSIAYGPNSQFDNGTAFSGTGTNLVYSGTITFNGAILSANLEIAGATLAGNGVFSGIVDWTSGDLASGTLTVATNAVLKLRGSTIKHLGGTGTLINYGSVIWSETNDIQTGNAAGIVNQPGALFDIQNNQSLAIANGGTITNFGTLRKSAGGGDTLITVPLYNAGLLDVQSGSIAYGANSQFNDGTAFSGTGTNLVYSGTITFNGAIASANLEIAGATLAGNGVFSGIVDWTSGDLASGTLTVATNAVLKLRGSTIKHLSGTGTLINYGSVIWSEANDIQTGNSAGIVNQAGALFDIQNNQSLAIANGGTITNLGVIRKSAGGGSTLITVPLYNAGTLDVQSGSMAYGAGSQFNDGTTFSGTGTNLVYSGTVTFNGAISSANLEIAGATLAGNGVFSGIVDWTSGDLSDKTTFAIATNGVLNIVGVGTKNLWGAAALVNYGHIVWAGSNDLNTLNSSRFINQPGALFDIQNNQSFTIWNGGAITNLGIFRKSTGTGNTLITVPMYSSGTVDVQTGTITFGTYSQTGGRLSFGLNSLTSFGRLVFNNGIAFSGILGMDLNGGYSPVAGDAFSLITYPSHSGTFASFDLPASHAWQTDNSIYDATAVRLTVLNTRPRLAPIAVPIGDEGTPVTFTASASDPDLGQTLTFSLASQPGGATINPSTGAFSWTPTEAQGPSTNTFTVQVADSGSPPLTNSRSVTIVVNEVNIAPVFTGVPTQTVSELTLLTVTNAATDADLPANTLTYSLLSAPAGVNLDSNTGVITWMPTEAQGPSTNLITLRVTDSNPWAVNAQPLSATNSFTVIVNEVNQAPVFTGVATQTVAELTLLTVTNAATDIDLPANTLTYSLLSAPVGVDLDTNTGVITWMPTEAQGPSTNLITLRVTDSNPWAINAQHLSATNSFTVVVNEVNNAPVLQSITDQTQHAGTPVQIAPIATDSDIPTNALTFSLDLAPANLTINFTNGSLRWIPTQVQLGTNFVTVRVTDYNPPAVNEPHLSDLKTFRIIVLPPEPARLVIRRLPFGLVLIEMFGGLDMDYACEVSTDLIHWETYFEIRLYESPFLYIDPDSAYEPLRFYRLREL